MGEVLPGDIQGVIASYLIESEVVRAQYILGWRSWITSIRFPPAASASKYEQGFVAWLTRWGRHMNALRTISITYAKDRSRMISTLAGLTMPVIRDITMFNMLGLFDDMTPEVLVALVCLFRKNGGVVRDVRTDARILSLCGRYINGRACLHTLSTIGSRMTWSDTSTEVRMTDLSGLVDLPHHITITCVCFQSGGHCRTLPMRPSHWDLIHR